MYSGCLAASKFILRKSIPVFGSFKHFTENAFRFTENQLPCLFGQTFYKKWNSFFMENQFPCLFCGSFYEKYECLTNSSTCIT